MKVRNIPFKITGDVMAVYHDPGNVMAVYKAYVKMLKKFY